jgi:pyruvate formate lyase activating enzyme
MPMETRSNFLINISVLYRNIQKYLDRALAKYDIGSGQVTFLFLINEHEGITMQEASRTAEVDKGTATKGIQKLVEQGYVEIKTDENDKRVKRLYTTQKAAAIISALYECRNECRSAIAKDVDFDIFDAMLEKACANSRMYLAPSGYQQIKIGGMQKMTLLDYPDKVACTIFTGGCNFKCPFCHNKDLVFLPENYEYFDLDEVMEYLGKRKGLLDGVCISGGEPLIQENLMDFIREIKKLGYLVKLDTNGNYPERLKEIVQSGLIDYVAMDIKNCPDKYAMTVGQNETNFSIENIEESVSFLMEDNIDYEFRTTVVRELHTKEDLVAIAHWIRGTKKYYLQQYMDSGNVIAPGFSAYNKEEMEGLLAAVREVLPAAQLRGVKEG